MQTENEARISATEVHNMLELTINAIMAYAKMKMYP